MSTGGTLQPSKVFCTTTERKDSRPTRACMIAQIGSEKIICEDGDPFADMSL